ncbi:MAG TPA: stage III sporulation protein AE [Caproicibacter sp.]|nr:stage III sporulation protein AE [Caproicibacter sp.]
MKKTVCFLILILAAFLFHTAAFAEQTASSQSSMESYYQEQLEQSGADKLQDKLPDDTKKILQELGISGSDWNSITSITPQNYFEKILSVFTGKAKNPLRVLASVIAVILLCALLDGMKLSFGEKPLGGIIGMVGTLCICTIVVQPIVACISDAADVLKASSGFLLACVPVLVAIMAAAGQSVSAGSYHLLMMAAGNVISIFATTVLVPMMNIFLALSVVSSVSPNINLNGLCNVLNKAVKWVMALGMTLFTGLITMHSIVASSLDSTGAKAAKFVVSSFVPVVGNALGEALNTVTGCVKMLKSGVGAFGLLAGLFVFLPVIAECVLWILTLMLCSGISQVFELKEITGLLKASSDVVSTMLAILLCCMMVLIISTVVMLVIGGVT